MVDFIDPQITAALISSSAQKVAAQIQGDAALRAGIWQALGSFFGGLSALLAGFLVYKSSTRDSDYTKSIHLSEKLYYLTELTLAVNGVSADVKFLSEVISDPTKAGELWLIILPSSLKNRTTFSKHNLPVETIIRLARMLVYVDGINKVLKTVIQTNEVAEEKQIEVDYSRPKEAITKFNEQATEECESISPGLISLIVETEKEYERFKTKKPRNLKNIFKRFEANE